MNRTGADDRRRRQASVGRRTARVLRPTVAALEGRLLLSTFTVTKFGVDDGSDGTLSWAVGQANSTTGADTIDFDSTLFDAPRTITLGGAELELTDTAQTTISGPGAGLLTVSGNQASRVFEVYLGASAALSGLTVTGGNVDNVVGGRGGGLFNLGTLTLTNAVVTANSSSGVGGGLSNFGTLTLTNSTVSGNSAKETGGGLDNPGGNLTLTNATVTGNSAGSLGGGLYSSGGNLTLINATVSGNSAVSNGAGLYVAGGSAALTNSIVAHNTGGSDGDIGGAVSGTHNLVGDGSGLTGLSNGVDGNQVGTAANPIDPLLTALGDYGGPTPTLALEPGSPAVGGGGSGSGVPSTDQRGFARAGGVDVGAFQIQGTALVVNSTNDGDFSSPGEFTLRQAINLANALPDPDTITFSSLFNTAQTISQTSGQFNLTDADQTTISGPGAGSLTISGNAANRVFQVDAVASAAISGLRITGGSSDDGGGLLNNGTLSLTDATVSGNHASLNGGGIFNKGTLTLANTTVSGNSVAKYSGGGLYNHGALTLTNSTVSGNSALRGGGLWSNGSPLLLTSTTVSGNTATYGGGLYTAGGVVAISGSTISGNTAPDGGGGLQNAGGTLTLADTTISGNSVSSYGGGLYNAAGELTLTNCTLSGNTAGDWGGALANQGTATLINTIVRDNSAYYGGGLDNRKGTLTLTNCTVTGNTGTDGGGLLNASTADLINCTVSLNTSRSGAVVNTGALTLTNTIVADQSQDGTDILGNVSGTHNLVANGGGMTGLTNGSDGNLVGTSDSPINPGLAPLGDYGGPTLTMALLPGSPAISAGISGNDVPTTDQRGFARTDSVDIGAFQSQGGAIVVNMTADGVGSDPGQLSLRQAINLANVLTGPDTITFSSLFDTAQTITLTNGPLTLSDIAKTTILVLPQKPALTISGNHVSGVFQIAAGASVTLTGLTITGGSAVDGAGIHNLGTLTLTEATVSGNLASGKGGGVYNGDGATLSATSVNVSGNTAKSDGGGIFNLGNLELTSSTISDNGADGKGGGLYNGGGGGTLSLTDVPVSGNSANGDGGGIFNSGSFNPINVTISGNTSTSNGGGLYNDGKSFLFNLTIAGNFAQSDGGGVFNNASFTLVGGTVSRNSATGHGGGFYNSSPGSLSLSNTIVAEQLTGGDLQGAVSGVNNLIGDGTGMTGLSNGVGNNQVGTTPSPINPLLAPLGGYGSLFQLQTFALLPGSPALGRGDAAVGLPYDERTFPRLNGPIDIGAFESGGFIVTPVLGSTPQWAELGKEFKRPLAVNVQAVNLFEPVDGGIITFSAPSAGASATLSAATATIENGQASVTATANSAPGSYTVKAAADISDAADFSLTNLTASSPVLTSDPGAVLEFDDLASLRAAIAYANSHPGPDVIRYHAPAGGTNQPTIELDSPLVLTDPATTTIIGPGRKLLTLKGDGKNPVIEVEGGSLALSGVTISGGRGTLGGGVLNERGTLALTRVILGNNAVSGYGGGLFNAGTARLKQVIVQNNHAKVGGGIANFGKLQIIHVTIRHNISRVASAVFQSRAARFFGR